MAKLSIDQINQYNEKGFVAPINVLSSNDALEIRNEIEFIEKKWPNELEGLGRNYVHLISAIFDKVVHNSKILDAVESVIGNNILVCGTTLFIKNPNEKGFVSFHQDAKYIGLEPHNWVTAWIAITDANEKNGCMRMWPGSHKNNLKDHNEKFNEGNLLTRGQTVENVPIDDTTPVILSAGQMSLHHPTIVHGSGLNKSNDRRIGFVVQSYIGSNVKQVLGKMYVQQARGDDKYKFHKHVERPSQLMGKNEVNIRNKANSELQKIFYNGASMKGKF
ncbi:phytanoyl-CoA dioxygenase family protein [Candidatus Pelagibacter sp.]|nr:phytanoyl-CoA dioxygenase family protein [Candidatus Pelagibacter sp.]MDA9663486.1 phytanoyl-CoA dioxygenase family protein [Candidatus Pelagibacter sp.]